MTSALSYWEALLQAERMHRRLPPIHADSDVADIPLSGAQRRLWFLHQLDPADSAYNMTIQYRLRGSLNTELLIGSLGILKDRHRILDTVFYEKDGEPYQKTVPRPAAIRIERLDSSEADLETLALEWVAAETNKPFNLNGGPVFEAALGQVSQTEHLLVFRFHHIIADALSLDIFINEFAEIYNALENSRLASLPELPVQYSAYAVWEQRYVANAGNSTLMDYWSNKLASADTRLDLNLAAAAETAGPTELECDYRADMPLDIYNEMLDFISLHPEFTVYNIMLSAYRILLFRYTGQSNLIIGSTMANRNRLELRHLIGFFANTLPLTTNVEIQDSFLQVLNKEKQTINEAIAYQHVSFDKLVSIMHLDRTPGENPLFQTMFTYVQSGAANVELSKLSAEALKAGKNSSAFNLTVGLNDTGSGVQVFYEYSNDKWNEALLWQFNRHYMNILRQLLRRPEAAIHSHMFLTEEEIHQVIYEWNDTGTNFGRLDSRRLVSQIKEQAAKHGQLQAVSIGREKSLSYRELDLASDALAVRLEQLGIRRNSIVGLGMERSFELVISILAVLKCGGSFMPLDPQLPLKRLNHMIWESSCALIITQEQYANLFAGMHDVVVSGISSYPPDISYELVRNESAEPSDLAYVIYTSGSTGTPKGAMNSYGGLCNRLCWMQQQFGLDETDKVLQKTPLTFDVAVWELLWPLLHGAELVLARPEKQHDPEYIGNIIVERQITTIHFVPAILKLFIDSYRVERCISLKNVICSGEELSTALRDSFFSKSGAHLFNLYGPAEAAIDVTWWDCAEKKDHLSSVPIGKPISNLQIYILDTNLLPVPVGVYGEICIGGIGVGLGYIGNEELTSRCFVPNPYSKNPSECLYRTGDLGKFLDNGTIIYGGRTDHQIKLNGARIELGEIEAVFRGYSRIKEFLVHPQKLNDGGQILIGYYVSDEEVAAAELRSYAGAYLPTYMIPGIFMQLEQFPLNRNGKINRHALPMPDPGAKAAGAVQLPKNELQAAIVSIWQELLGLEDRPIGISENFFDLGGHSLLALKLVSAVNKKFNASVTIMELYLGEFTISRMADLLTEPSVAAAKGQLTKSVLAQLGMSLEEILQVGEGVLRQK
ncbi:amino acid adenylation domain-containing protein [Paenibacillus sp. CN-4]|uniref:non-ribosomal peptide synthetase n=1 Tax=Paenibacillus nanchangensis TaxID=3348343 RepID=UPI003978E905